RRELVACLPALQAVAGRFAKHLAGLIEDEIVPGGVVPQRWRAQARPFVHHRADRLLLVPVGERVVLVATTFNMNSSIGCWDAQTGEQLGPLLDGVARHAYRDGSDVVIAGIDGWGGRARRWAVPSGRELAPLRPQRRPFALRRRVMEKVTAMTSYRDGEHEIVAAGDESGAVRCFDSASGEPVGGLARLSGRVTALWSYQLAGRAHLAAGDEFGQVWRWLPGPDPRPQQVHGKHHQYVLHGAAYRDGDRTILVTGATDQAAYRWDAETGASLGDRWVMKDVIGGICSFPDGDRTILAIGGFCQIQRFDTVTGQRHGDLIQGHQEPISDTGYAEVAGRPMLFTCDLASVWRWDARTGEPLPVMD
ncbi:WD40 repeat domain-containing protein, partial [Rhizocola hellebori]|uniref:WD40 repeat domain-containing protein n=1 Tax=Rhizocola hellebori TaxID=1392758 RepID=UPI001942C4CA